MSVTRVEKLKRHWEGCDGASERAIAAFQRKVGAPLPADYREMLRFSDGGSAPLGPHGLRLQLDSLGLILPCSRIYEAPPGLFLIGELTGLNTGASLYTLLLDARKGKPKFAWMFGCLFEELRPLATTLEQSLRDLDPIVRRIKRESDTAKDLDVVYLPTPSTVVSKMIELGGVRRGDLVYDLGCGDGRIVVAAAKQRGARGVGFDLEPERLKEARANARAAGVQDLVKIRRQSLLEVDLGPADVIMLYLRVDLIKKLVPRFRKLRPGVRIVAHAYPIPGFEPEETAEASTLHGGTRNVYLWRTPLRKRSD